MSKVFYKFKISSKLKIVSLLYSVLTFVIYRLKLNENIINIFLRYLHDLLLSASRFRDIHDFGMVSLDITSTIPEDAGVYMCKAVNKAGEAVTSTSMLVRRKFQHEYVCAH